MTVTIHTPVTNSLTNQDVAPWHDIPVAIAVDLAPERLLDIALRPLNPPGKQPKLFGRAFTARCEPPDFGAVVHALELVGPGEVLVIAAAGRTDFAMIGEILSGHLRDSGCPGLICDGAVRDVATLANWSDFSVYARAANPRGPTGAVDGDIQLPVEIGDHVVTPGDLIIGDDDGLVALSPDDVTGLIESAQEKVRLEAKWINGLANKQSVTDVFGLAPAIEVNGS